MTGLTQDTHLVRYGTGDGNSPVAWPLGANQTVYFGAVALQSGSGSTTVGNLKNAATAGASDLVVGMIGDPAGGTTVKTGLGIVGGSTDGSVWIDVLTGDFFFQSGSGADALSASTNGKQVFYAGENAIGPIAAATSAGNTRPILGIQLPQDPSISGGVTPGSNYFPVRLQQVTLGGP